MTAAKNLSVAPQGFWLKTHFYREGNLLHAVTYSCIAGHPEVFKASVDLRPIVKAVTRAHNALHAQNKVSGEEVHDALIGFSFGDLNPITQIKKTVNLVTHPTSIKHVLGQTTGMALAPLTVPGNFVASKMAKIPVLGGVYNAAHRLALMPFTVTQQVMEGGNVSRVALRNLKQALADTKTVGPWAQTVIAFVPGVGTGVSAAIGAGLALAEGKPISEAMMEAVKGAMPGGAVAKMAFGAAEAAVRGKPLDQVAIAALPISDQNKRLLVQGITAAKDIAAGKNVARSVADHAIASLPPAYAKAVKIGVAMGHAKNLQAALSTGAIQAAHMAIDSFGGKNKEILHHGLTIGEAMGHAKNINDALKTGASGAAGAALNRYGGSVAHQAARIAAKVGKSNLVSQVGFAVRGVVQSKASNHSIAAAFPAVGMPAIAAYDAASKALSAIDNHKSAASWAKAIVDKSTSAATKGQLKSSLEKWAGATIQKAVANNLPIPRGMGSIAQAMKLAKDSADRAKKLLAETAAKAKAGDVEAMKLSRVITLAHNARSQLKSIKHGKGKTRIRGKAPVSSNLNGFPALLVSTSGHIIPGRFLEKKGAPRGIVVRNGKILRGNFAAVSGDDIFGCLNNIGCSNPFMMPAQLR